MSIDLSSITNLIVPFIELFLLVFMFRYMIQGFSSLGAL